MTFFPSYLHGPVPRLDLVAVIWGPTGQDACKARIYCVAKEEDLKPLKHDQCTLRGPSQLVKLGTISSTLTNIFATNTRSFFAEAMWHLSCVNDVRKIGARIYDGNVNDIRSKIHIKLSFAGKYFQKTRRV